MNFSAWNRKNLAEQQVLIKVERNITRGRPSFILRSFLYSTMSTSQKRARNVGFYSEKPECKTFKGMKDGSLHGDLRASSGRNLNPRIAFVKMKA